MSTEKRIWSVNHDRGGEVLYGGTDSLTAIGAAYPSSVRHGWVAEVRGVHEPSGYYVSIDDAKRYVEETLQRRGR